MVVTKRDGDGNDRRVGMLKRGDYFGEQALLHEDRRLATVTTLPPGVECLTLERGYDITMTFISKATYNAAYDNILKYLTFITDHLRIFWAI